MSALNFFRRARDSAAQLRGQAHAPDHRSHPASSRPPLRLGGRSLSYRHRPRGGGALHSARAASVSKLQAQVSRLIAVLESEHGREPDLRDEEFWRAYQRLVEAHAGERSGPHGAFEPIAKGTGQLTLMSVTGTELIQSHATDQ